MTPTAKPKGKPRTTGKRQTPTPRQIDQAFLGGLLTAVWTLGGACDGAREQLLEELDDATALELIAYAKRNGEYRSSGLAHAAKYAMRSRALNAPQKGK